MKKGLSILFVFLFSFFISFSYSFAFVAPTITLKDVGQVTTSDANLLASLDSLGSSTYVEYWFEYSADQNNLSSQSPIVKLTAINKNISFKLSKLSPSTTYYYRLCYRDLNSGSACMDTKNFKTYSNPSSNILSATNIADVKATFKGVVGSIGYGTKPTASYWFEYGIGLKMTSKKSTTVKTVDKAGEVSFDVVSLLPSTLYYYDLCVKNEFNISSCSSMVNFQTLDKTPDPKTDADFTFNLNDVSLDVAGNAYFNFNVPALGTAKSITYWVEYGISADMSNNIAGDKAITAKGDYKLSFKTFSFDTTYYYRVCGFATNTNPYCTNISTFTLKNYRTMPLGVKSTGYDYIDNTKVKLKGSVEGFGFAAYGYSGYSSTSYVNAWFQIYDKDNIKVSETTKIKVTDPNIRSFSFVVSNLIPGNLYKYNACVMTGIIYCEFDYHPFVSLKNFDVQLFDAKLDNGNLNLTASITNIGTSFNTASYHFEYGPDKDFVSSVNSTQTKEFNASSTLLTEFVSNPPFGSDIYYRFCSNNGLVDSCSDSKKIFLKQNINLPSVGIYSIVKNSLDSFTISSNVVDFGGDTSVYSYFQYSYDKNNLMGDGSSASNTSDVLLTNKNILNSYGFKSIYKAKDFYFKACVRNSQYKSCTDIFNFKLLDYKMPYNFGVSDINKGVKIDKNLVNRLKGRVLLQVQGNGALHYLNPNDSKRYFLGGKADIMNVILKVGVYMNNKEFDLLKDEKQLKTYLGKVIINTSDSNKAYYINPDDSNLYYLKDSDTALNLLKKFAMGISNSNLKKIGYFDFSSNVQLNDSDSDGLSDEDEINIFSTNPFAIDTDMDGYDDKTEIKGGYSPIAVGKLDKNRQSDYIKYIR